MRSLPHTTARSIFFFGILFLAAGALLAVAIHTLTANNTLGADFATFWIAAKAVLFEGKSPYSLAVTQTSQNFIYHRLAYPGEDQVSFAYPLPAIFLILPVAWMDLPWAQSFWMSLTIVSLLSALFLISTRVPGSIRFTFFLLYPVIFGIILGNFSVIFSAFILIFLSLIYLNKSPSIPIQIVSAGLLSLTSVKPQFAWGYLLLALCVGVRYRYPYFLSILIGLPAFQLVLAFLWRPAWLSEWMGILRSYSVYTNSKAAILLHLERVLPANWVYPATGVILFMGALIFFLILLAWWKDKVSPALLPAWTGFLIYLIHPHGISYEQLTFIIPFFFWVTLSPTSLWIKMVWFVSILLSWLLFWVSAVQLLPNAVNEYPFIIYTLWLVCFALSEWVKIKKNSKVLNEAN